MNHLSQAELQEHAGGALPRDQAAAAEVHLRTCAECRTRLTSFRSLEQALRSLPLETAPRELAGNVLKRLGIREAPSWLYTLFMNFAPLAALIAVLAVVYVILGRPSPGSAGGSGESARSLFQLADQYSAAGIRSVDAWVGTYLAFAKGSAGLTGFLLVFLGAIALLDKFVFMPLIRRRL